MGSILASGIIRESISGPLELLLNPPEVVYCSGFGRKHVTGHCGKWMRWTQMPQKVVRLSERGRGAGKVKGQKEVLRGGNGV